ncbi:TspO/MBR family protein [Halalkalibacter krulwichiae]|uniref:TspO/MBR family protein n=1 Tax=Halalkalibacter krulwichiae TaxID=199441 RepID=A0A1X9MJ42_9BACI|nr:TspO/MBR family protein [Halalkalibacter krulwichiae]ARK32710.1 hypothetical protein BkAM31D_24210 [Halalkalibacter krulwichiae]
MLRFFFTLFALIFVLLINYLANALPFNEQTTSDVANRLEVLFTPAGYVFSIWGVIYLLLTIWVLRQLLPSQRDSAVYKVGSPLFILSCFLNSFWLFLWHYEYFLLSVLVMISLLATLLVLYHRTHPLAKTLFDLLPFSLYLGWISVATIANISYFLVDIGWGGFGLSNVTWTLIMLLVSAVLAIVFRIKRGDPVFALVFVWALIGIGVDNLSAYPLVAYSAFILATIVFVYALFGKHHEISIYHLS